MKKVPIPNPFNNAPVYYTAETDSTMQAAMDQFLQLGISGIVVRAGFQTQGRGRIVGRSWKSSPEESLMMTLALDTAWFPQSRQLFPLLTGLGVVDFILRTFGIETQIKWPNDILADGRKICGILCESRDGCMLAGVGINLWQEDFPKDLRNVSFPAVSVRMSIENKKTVFAGKGLPESVDERREANNILLQDLLNSLYAAYNNEKWLSEIREKLFGIRQRVGFNPGAADDINKSETIYGTVQGIAEDGGLIIDDTTWYAGEISSLTYL